MKHHSRECYKKTNNFLLNICVKRSSNIAKFLSSTLINILWLLETTPLPHPNKTAQDFSYSYECMHGENNKKHLQIFEVPIMLWNINIYVLNIKYSLSIEYHSTMNICSILHPVLRASAKIFAFFVEKLLSCCVGNKRRWCDEVEIIDKKHSNCEFLPE